MKSNKFAKKVLSLIIVSTMIVSMLPISALAAESDVMIEDQAEAIVEEAADVTGEVVEEAAEVPDIEEREESVVVNESVDEIEDADSEELTGSTEILSVKAEGITSGSNMSFNAQLTGLSVSAVVPVKRAAKGSYMTADIVDVSAYEDAVAKKNYGKSVAGLYGLELHFYDKKGKEIKHINTSNITVTVDGFEASSYFIGRIDNKVNKIQRGTEPTFTFTEKKAYTYVIAGLEDDGLVRASGETDGDGNKRFNLNDENVNIEVVAPEDAFADGVAMEASDVSSGTTLNAEDDEELVGSSSDDIVVAYNISFYNEDGVEQQPEKEVTVKIATALDMSKNYKLIHIADNGETNEVENAVFTENGVEFVADSFSVYAVVEGDDVVTPRITYHFLDGEGNPYLFLNTAGETVSTQIIKNGESLQAVPAPGLLNNQAFNGWYIWENGSYGDEVKFGEAISVDEPKDVYVKAHYGAVIYVTFYQYAAGKIVLERKQIPQNEDGKYTFDMSSVTVPAPKTTLKFMGWSQTMGTDASEENGDAPNSRPLLNNGVVEFTKDTDVYPVYYSGIWIVFVSAETGMGASYVPSYFIPADSSNASAAKPSDPGMTGYAFDGWFTTPENDYISAESSGSFNFNTSFTDLANYTNDRGEVVLYGHWKGGDTTYVVVYWKQQVGNSKTAVDSEKTYDYAGQTDPISGTTGSKPTPTTAQQTAPTGFQYSRYELVDVQDDGTTVASSGLKADGSSILNVYFDRKLITMRFSTSTNINYNDNWSNATTYTGLYGQTWAQAGYTTNWPSAGSGYRWEYFTTGNSTKGQVYLGQFILPDDTRDTTLTEIRLRRDKVNVRTYYFYLENADGTWPTSTTITGAGSNQGTFYFSDKYEGYKVVSYRIGNSGDTWVTVNSTTNSDGTHNYNPDSVSATTIGNNSLSIRYARESYDIKYLNPLNENSVLASQSKLFGASLASAKPTVTTVDLGVPGYEWDGNWYKDKNCTVEFNFTTETMPLGGTKVYAGKTPIYYYIKIDPNGGELQTGQSTWRWVKYGDDTTYTYDNITRDYIEYKGSGQAYYYYYDEFDINRRDDIWNYTYMASNPRTARYTTGEIPAGGGSAWLGTDEFSYEADAYSLIGWYDVTDGTDNMKPFKAGTAITRDTIIQAQWRRTGEYSVVYHIEAVDANGDALLNTENERVEGANNPVDTAKYADKSDSAILDKIGVVPAGYSFVGWYYNGKIYQPGDVFQVLARLSDDNKTVHIYPVMETVETLPVEVIDITYDPNGGVFTDDADTELNAMITAAKGNSEGTSYNPKLTTNSDGTKTISDLQINEGLELLSADAVQNGVEINGEKVLGRGFRLKEWNTEADGTGTKFALNTRIGVDDKEPVPNKVYAIWEEVFYVYHPATGKFQTLVNGDSTDRWALTTGFDADGTKDKTQYTDYYYGGFAVYAEGNKAAEGITFNCGDASGTIADTYWTRVKAAKSADKWNASDTGAVYYLKEVPTSYLAQPVSCTIRDQKGKGAITSLHFLSVTDTNIYRAGGIKLRGSDKRGTFATKFTLEQVSDNIETEITAQSQFGLNGYLTVVNNGTENGSYAACQAYWTTYDNVNVYGIEANIRDITID